MITFKERVHFLEQEKKRDAKKMLKFISSAIILSPKYNKNTYIRKYDKYFE